MSRPAPTFLDNDILPSPPSGAVPVLHNREYRVQSYRLESGRLLIQGALRDQKPPGLFIPGDPNPLTIHHMMLSMTVAMPSMVIEDVQTSFPAYPGEGCPSIIGHYDKLIGLSIARGFTHKVRELFGGPRGCSHTTALLQAMAPIAMQSFKSMEIAEAALEGRPNPVMETPTNDDSWKRLVNTCHVWAEDGQKVELKKRGGDTAPIRPLTMVRRMQEMGMQELGTDQR